jgi:hypothetical protein
MRLRRVFVVNRILQQLISWERGLLSEGETLAFFQELIETGLAWKMTGSVRRYAAELVHEGRIPVNGQEAV